MHRSMVYTLGEVGTCIPQLPGSHKVKKSEEKGQGGRMMGMEYVEVALAPNRRWGMAIDDV